MNCVETRPYLQAFVDNELSPERAIDVQQHLAFCVECTSEVELTRSLCRATRTSVASTAMCPEFQSRLCQCLADERRRQDSAVDRPLTWRVIAPLSTAAAVALFFGVHFNQETEAVVAKPEVARASSDNLVDFLVQQHAASQPPESNDPRSIAYLEPQLGFPVRAPNLDRFGAHFEGANMVPVNTTRVAMLRYNLGGRRVTLYMYDPEQLPMRSQRALQPSVVGSHAVFIGNRRGYSIATCEQQGVGYAVTGDLSREESAELVAAVYR